MSKFDVTKTKICVMFKYFSICFCLNRHTKGFILQMQRLESQTIENK